MKTNVLIVDDSQTIRVIIRRHLTDLPGLIFFEAGSADDAEQIIQEQAIHGDPIHLITLDWMMPGTSGLQMLKRLRAVPAFSKHPVVVMLTAESLPEHCEECKQHGASAYIVKPFSKEALLAVVTKALEEVKKESQDVV